MRRLLYILVAQLIQALPTKEDLREKDIEKLEREKNDLFIKINDAIDDSVKSLQQTNDSDALIGITYIKDLKNQIKELNETNVEDDAESYLENRRKSNKHEDSEDQRRQLLVGHTKKEPEFDFDKLFGKKGSKKWKKRFNNRIQIQKKLDEWLKQREIEKEKIKKYKKAASASNKHEKCPRFGIAKPKRNDGIKSKHKYSGKYPCCRKCCKKSYMGCL